jgi:hypothetical protein
MEIFLCKAPHGQTDYEMTATETYVSCERGGLVAGAQVRYEHDLYCFSDYTQACKINTLDQTTTSRHHYVPYSFVNIVSFIALTSNSCVHVLLGCVCRNQYVSARSLGCTR